jgi:hypothetical protein
MNHNTDPNTDKLKRQMNDQCLAFLIIGVILVLASLIHTDATVCAIGMITTGVGAFGCWATR